MFTLTLKHQGPSECDILIMQVFSGKTNRNKTLYGRVMRHKNVNMCAIGALGMYLAHRFEYTDEMSNVDFTDNHAWFDIKLLTDPNANNNQVPVKDQSYANAIKGICTALNIDSAHAIHIGRCVGAVTADMLELQTEETKLLGNWRPDTHESTYSSKFPLLALRAMGGHKKYLDRFTLRGLELIRRSNFSE